MGIVVVCLCSPWLGLIVVLVRRCCRHISFLPARSHGRVLRRVLVIPFAVSPLPFAFAAILLLLQFLYDDE